MKKEEIKQPKPLTDAESIKLVNFCIDILKKNCVQGADKLKVIPLSSSDDNKNNGGTD